MGHDAGVQIAAEFTIEPFVDGSPGPHVRAAIEVAESAGLMGNYRYQPSRIEKNHEAYANRERIAKSPKVGLLLRKK